MSDETYETRNSSGKRRSRRVDAEIARVATHGVITLAQLARLDVDDDDVEYRSRIGRLHRLHRGVYAVGHTELTFEGHSLGAQLAMGPNALVSHLSAAALWGFIEEHRPPIHVTVPRKARGREDVLVHTTGAWTPDDLAQRHGIPLTSPARTILDCAATLPERQLKSVLRQAEVDRKVIHAQLHRMLDEHPGRRGAAALRTLLAKGARAVRSPREDDWVTVLDALGHHPRQNARVDGDELDLYLPELRLAIEVDSRRFHDTPTARLLDAEKQARQEARGIRVLRVREPPKAA